MALPKCCRATPAVCFKVVGGQDDRGDHRDFEIASEETDKKSVYAADDRVAAREELDYLKSVFEVAVQGDDGEEIRRRVGQRIRELERGVEAMEERAMED
ncbi:MAG: hypothetical protein Q9218_004216 [Villophora microphyllina]